MPYCNAVLNEVLRCCNVVPLSVQHGARKKINFKGFVIPKGAMIIQNLDSVMADPEVFPEPEVFDPTRFLDDDASTVANQRMIAFSVGR